MNPAESAETITQTLLDLERLLVEEDAALRRLDREAIDAITEKKLAVLPVLEGLQGRLGDSERPLLARIKERALSNQLLLVHARDSLQGVLELVTGGRRPGYAPEIARTGRLSVRG
ncbi:MAG TPA: hypothetical protein VKY73_00840 [Polyangiaceae bacterium]|nr:hypothetical protein [Polyangiaceae bacterium]